MASDEDKAVIVVNSDRETDVLDTASKSDKTTDRINNGNGKKKGKEKKKARDRGTGGLYLRGKTWWIKCSANGRVVRESTHTSSKEVAKGLLIDRLAAANKGETVDPSSRRLRIADLFGAVVRDYEINKLKSLRDLKCRWRLHLQPFFGHIAAVNLTSDLIAQYVAMRLEEDASNATINRELAILRRSFALAMEANPPKIRFCPKITMLKERNVRKGFVKDEEYDGLAAACARVGTWLRAMLELGFTFGWRFGEHCDLRVGQIDFRDCRIRLDPDTTKNDDGRVVKFRPGSALESLLVECCAGKSSTDYVFTRPNGTRVKNIYGVWHTVCCDAGLSHRFCRTCEAQLGEDMFCATCGVRRRVRHTRTKGLLFHDLRRSAARNARNSGVAENVIMKMGGWRTRAMFDRYAIIDEPDLDSAIEKIEGRRALTRRDEPSITVRKYRRKKPITNTEGN